jgi:hypothetical protein
MNSQPSDPRPRWENMRASDANVVDTTGTTKKSACQAASALSSGQISRRRSGEHVDGAEEAPVHLSRHVA